MSSSYKNAISPTRAEDYSQWYQEVVKMADLAESSPIRGCMIIKPWGYAIWENIQKELDKKIKETGHQNFYFPMFIPLSYMAKEAEHIDGFAKECAVVTHHRLEVDSQNKLVPSGKLEEPLVIRPTSEVVIGEAFARWVNSYRDLPILGNQWANIVRWEMRPRIFLRTSEFLWQEGHTVHATAAEAIEETNKMLDVYKTFVEEFLAMSVIVGEKTRGERFPGAENTYCIEAMMQDKKALQAGTSHFLGQTFSKAFKIKFLSSAGKEEFAWTTSWGVSTRLIGGLIMSHSDDDGLVLPPKISPLHVVIIPIIHDAQQSSNIMQYCESIALELKASKFCNEPIKVLIDTSMKSTGNKIWSWIKKGVPIRIEIGEREMMSKNVCVARRDHIPSSKAVSSKAEFIQKAEKILSEIQSGMLHKTQKFIDSNIVTVNSRSDFLDILNNEKHDIGFLRAFWKEDEEIEKMLKEKYHITPRCIPLIDKDKRGRCIFNGTEDGILTVFGKAY
ncbi:Proline--tRNA ligase [Candidatus Fokinia solitaria]|uniref:Proline--tRNA ligase n=1 Tax=Candidatus Fokinia solitaria TaxID=1802984 RepID=A0A2U8BS89_9RICK|nr:proline--tRNA ligase [Candidatus Fokinia solitaria]AWD33175.1 Proline--tRNA ligase [Candidatus Fokinia solitaria]